MEDDLGTVSLSGKLDELQHLLTARVADPENAQVSDASIESLIQEVENAKVPFKFDESLIWGDWQLVWQLNTKKAPTSQKTLATLPQYSNFMFNEKGEKVFRNIVQLSKQRVKIIADVSYDDPADVSDNPPNRLVSTIVAADLQARIGKRFGWKPLRIPLPLKGKGWLDIIHVSEQMRITRGNRGGLFVHLRPHLLEEAQGATPIEKPAAQGPIPIEKRTDFPVVLGTASMLCLISGMVNIISFLVMGIPCTHHTGSATHKEKCDFYLRTTRVM
jgi:hypothetical protein